jgi:hypothetical protein
MSSTELVMTRLVVAIVRSPVRGVGLGGCCSGRCRLRDRLRAVDASIALFGWGFAFGCRSRETLGGQLLVCLLSGGVGLISVALKIAIP